ncbi:MAG: Rrf2 family transcriptional regulator [Fimbriimonadaceae bacterium]|jgi:Rrf2 family protein|nr:Rrf2 family transcriptional regulator [Fimbriimonadaceae bacterium]
MKFSAQEEYGIRCLMVLASRGEGVSLTIPEISKVEGLTPSHVAKLLSILRRAGYVKSHRGQTGGYYLTRKPEDIQIKDLLAVLGGRLFTSRFCDRHSGLLTQCVHHFDCVLRPLWASLQDAVDSVLDHLTLADVMAGNIEKATAHLPKPTGYNVHAYNTGNSLRVIPNPEPTAPK